MDENRTDNIYTEERPALYYFRKNYDNLIMRNKAYPEAKLYAFVSTIRTLYGRN